MTGRYLPFYEATFHGGGIGWLGGLKTLVVVLEPHVLGMSGLEDMLGKVGSDCTGTGLAWAEMEVTGMVLCCWPGMSVVYSESESWTSRAGRLVQYRKMRFHGERDHTGIQLDIYHVGRHSMFPARQRTRMCHMVCGHD